MTKKVTTISISRKTHEILVSMGKKGEPFENILTKLIERAERKSVPQVDPKVGNPSGRPQLRPNLQGEDRSGE